TFFRGFGESGIDTELTVSFTDNKSSSRLLAIVMFSSGTNDSNVASVVVNSLVVVSTNQSVVSFDPPSADERARGIIDPLPSSVKLGESISDLYCTTAGAPGAE